MDDFLCDSSTPVTGGWFELAFRKSDTKYLKHSKNIKQENYMMQGGQIALREFDTPFQIYEMFGIENEDWNFTDTMERPLTKHDCINLVFNHPESLQNVTFLIVPKNEIIRLGFKKTNIEVHSGYNLAMVEMPSELCFESFAAQENE